MFLNRNMLGAMSPRALPAAAFATAAALLLTACSNGSTGAAGGSNSGKGESIQVIAGFYPLEYAVQRVGGNHVSVTNLTKPGAEPHDLELTPQDVAKVSSAKLAVYTKGFQPAFDKAVTEQSAKGAYDVAKDADLKALGKHDDHDGHDHAQSSETSKPAQKDDHDHDHAKPSTTSKPAQKDDHDHDHGKVDPHFWLDPIRYGKVAKGIAAKLDEIDPGHKADFEKNAEAFVKELNTLDGEFTTGLKTCTNKNMVTSHAAFGYLTERYGLEQKAISGLSPEKEPEPGRLAEIATYVKANKVTTIYTETLVNPAVAKTVVSETGAQTAVLDPIEGLSDKSAGKDYLQVMRANLTTLKKGQSCQ